MNDTQFFKGILEDVCFQVNKAIFTDAEYVSSFSVLKCFKMAVKRMHDFIYWFLDYLKRFLYLDLHICFYLCHDVYIYTFLLL